MTDLIVNSKNLNKPNCSFIQFADTRQRIIHLKKTPTDSYLKWWWLLCLLMAICFVFISNVSSSSSVQCKMMTDHISHKSIICNYYHVNVLISLKIYYVFTDIENRFINIFNFEYFNWIFHNVLQWFISNEKVYKKQSSTPWAFWLPKCTQKVWNQNINDYSMVNKSVRHFVVWPIILLTPMTSSDTKHVCLYNLISFFSLLITLKIVCNGCGKGKKEKKTSLG